MLKSYSTRCAILFILVLGLFLNSSPKVFAHEISGYAEGELRLFPNEALYPGQNEQSASFAFQPEYYHEFKSGSSFTFVPFVRVDSGDQERTHFDIREFTFLWLEEDFELRVGVRKVFWGTTEVLHLVDIINQTDLVENTDTEDKLDQPMANLSFSANEVSQGRVAGCAGLLSLTKTAFNMKVPPKNGIAIGHSATPIHWAISISASPSS